MLSYFEIQNQMNFLIISELEFFSPFNEINVILKIFIRTILVIKYYNNNNRFSILEKENYR